MNWRKHSAILHGLRFTIPTPVDRDDIQYDGVACVESAVQYFCVTLAIPAMAWMIEADDIPSWMIDRFIAEYHDEILQEVCYE